MIFRIGHPERPSSPAIDKHQRLVGSWVLFLLAAALAIPGLYVALLVVSEPKVPLVDKLISLGYATIILGWPSLMLLFFAWRVRRPIRWRGRQVHCEDPPSAMHPG